MRYLVSILRISVLVAVVLSVANFSDIPKVKAAASSCTATVCSILGDGTIKMVGANPVFYAGGVGSGMIIHNNNQSTVISGGITVTTYGALTFSNLTITNGAKVTQEAIALSDINADGKTLKAAGVDKKVDLTITGKFELTNYGRIDVSAKGFPGGVYGAHQNGYGPGGGTAGNTTGTLSGGAYGGRSCTYTGFWSNTCVPGGASYAAENNNGSGGGANPSTHSNGARGGGIVKITTNQMYLDQSAQTFISANGEAINYGTVASPVYRSGGGAGGSIWIKATSLTSSFSPSDSPSATGYNQDKTKQEAWGLAGTAVSNRANFGKYIVANGAGLGGAGGRVKIDIATPISVQDCRVTEGDQIPTACNKDSDVTVSGTTINMNKVTIKADGSACPDPNNTACDSKRYFKSLTLENGAVITHEALIIDDMIRKPDKSYEKSITNQTTGKARWKKVDMEVTNAINFRSGGKIDVTGKGYPGAYFSWDGVNGIGDQGCNKDDMGHLVGIDGINPNLLQFQGNYGFGPDGGVAFKQNDFSDAGGGSYAGTGKPGKGQVKAINNPQVPYLNGIRLEWGSGGGADSHRDKAAGIPNADVACANGGAGGGIIDVKADTLNMAGFGSSSAMILADGERDVKTPALGPNTSIFMFQNDSNSVGSGGGAGGVIRLTFNNVTPMAGGSGISVAGGTNPLPGGDSDGHIDGIVPLNLKQVSAQGGNRSEYNRPSTGSGGGGGWIVLGSFSAAPTIQSKKIEAIVTWKEGTQDKTVKLYDILRSVVTN